MRPALGILAVSAILLPRVCLAQAAPAPATSPRVFVDVNVIGFGSQLSHERTFTGLFIKAGEQGRIVANYSRPTRPAVVSLDLAGGFLWRPWFAVGAGYSRASYTADALVAATVPSPEMFNAFGTGSRMTDALQRTEGAVRVFAAFLPVRTARFEWRLSAGPSFFHYSAEMVRDVSYTQSTTPGTPQNIVTLDGFETAMAHGNAVGLHAGTDLAYLLTRQVAITGGVRFSSALVTVKREPLSGIDQQFRLGGISVFLGGRFQFGHR
jgi:hypothetical protein